MSGSRYWNQVIIFLSPSTHIKEDYLLSEHLELVSLVSHRLCGCQGRQAGFCCSSDSSAPEKDALCSEAPDEDALVQFVVDFAFQTTKKISACRANVAWGTDWVKSTVVIHYGPRILLQTKLVAPPLLSVLLAREISASYCCPRMQRRPMK
jgi:hypothetical protein